MTQCISRKTQELTFKDEDRILSKKIIMEVKDLKYECNKNFYDVSYINMNPNKNNHIDPFYLIDQSIIDYDKKDGVIVAKNELTETLINIIMNYEDNIASNKNKNICRKANSILVFTDEYSKISTFLEILIIHRVVNISENEYYQINCDFRLNGNENSPYLKNIYADFNKNNFFFIKKNNLTDTLMKYLLMDDKELESLCGFTTMQKYKENILYFLKELYVFEKQDFSHFYEAYVKELYIKKTMNFLADLWD